MSEEQPRELPSFWPLEKTVVYLPGDHVEIKKSIDNNTNKIFVFKRQPTYRSNTTRDWKPYEFRISKAK